MPDPTYERWLARAGASAPPLDAAAYAKLIADSPRRRSRSSIVRAARSLPGTSSPSAQEPTRRMSGAVWPAVLGRFDWHALPFVRAWDNPTASEMIGAGAASIVIVGAIAAVVLITRYRQWRYLWSEWLTSLDHKKIGIMYIVLAFVMLTRALIEAVLMRMQQAVAINAPGLPRAGSFRAAVQHPRQHHDLLHGDAVPDRPDQLRHAAADRRARRRVPAAELDQPLADRRRGRAHDGLAGDRAILDRRLERISALYRARVQPRCRARLLDLGGYAVLDRLDADRAQLRRHDLQEALPRHDPDADAAVRAGRRSAPAS